MSREWKPGDVAAFDWSALDASVGLRVSSCRNDAHTGNKPHWHLSNGGWTQYDTSARALVVIDPETIPHLSDFFDEPREALMILARDVAEADRKFASLDLDASAAVLRWLAEQMPTPPKPDEPTGLGAVVEDAEGRRYVRQPDGWWRSDEPCALNWAGVAAVRILSEGWSE